ncbi:Gfo/Idh/MocA family oxidoreductase [Lysinibacillus capsici]|uniref:Gfo/Idh/MocA family oxidoreductase n=1 Tax=Lysinibacillus capsici TaxID=2115968 RepID=UPI0034E4C9D3
MSVLLVGSGYMSREYTKILQALNISFRVIGRGEESARTFENELKIKVEIGGLEKCFCNQPIPTHAIIATTVESLEENAIFLLEQGVKNILLEKPGAVTQEGITRIATIAKNKDANVYIAYNRRFYSSVLEAKKRILDDGGLTSFLFEFTEWGHIVKKSNKTKFQLENWFTINSTHVLDTAFYFGGKPKEISCYVQGQTDWHPSGCIYTGSGITEKNILFSYHANWAAPGSWKLELLTKKNRYIFRPFEKLHVQKVGELIINEINIDEKLDILFKPGLFRQTESFLKKNKLTSDLLTIAEMKELFRFFIDIKEGIT